MDFRDEIPQHRHGTLKIGNNPTTQWPYDLNALWSPSQHAFGFSAYGQDAVGAFMEAHNRRLTENYPLALYGDQSICRP
jgi:hypothetical protein